MEYQLKFDPKTIEHLGVKMYSTLPPALSELISNAYDADANTVEILFHEENGEPISITVKDNGKGMSSEEIQEKFLVIGRNRRHEEGDRPSHIYGRMPTGKKGLGKLALFGLAKKVILYSVQGGLINKLSLSWDELLSSRSVYNPNTEIENRETTQRDGTSITLKDLKRKSAFDLESTADSLSKIFIVDENFRIFLKKINGEEFEVTNGRRYEKIEKEFSWGKSSLELDSYEYEDDIEIKIMTSKTPIKPNSGLRGITIFSRGKLVNLPEFFSSSTSSHFYQYLTGFVKADFIDLLEEDVISTNRQSLNWENEKMSEFRGWLNSLVSKVESSWRVKRKEKKGIEFKAKTGIDKERWFLTLPEEVKESVQKIVNTLSDDDGVDESFNPVVRAVYDLAPEYPNLHWRHLHPEIKTASKIGYEGKNYYNAFMEATKRFINKTREYSGVRKGTDYDLMGAVFGPEDEKVLKVAVGYLRANGLAFTESTVRNIEYAQRKLSQATIEGGRNIVAHEEQIDLARSGLFSERDCLDMLSLISHLMYRIENVKNTLEEVVEESAIESS